MPFFYRDFKSQYGILAVMVFILSFIFLFIFLTNRAYAETNSSISNVDSLTKKILLKEIELEKFNLRYRMIVGKQGRWAGWRYASLQEANFCLNLASGIFNTTERSSHFTVPEHLDANKLANSSLVSMIGYVIGAAAGALELGITEFHDLKAGKEGFSPKLAKEHVLNLKNEIDQLLLQRNELVKIECTEPLLHARAQIDLAEGKILQDLRDLALHEYQRFHISGRRFVAFQKSLYFLDMTKYTFDSVGSLMSFLAIHTHQRRLDLPCGIMYDIAGSLIIATPYLSRGIGIIVGSLEKQKTLSITDGVRGRGLIDLEADSSNLEKTCREYGVSNNSNNSLNRLALYKNEDYHFADEFERRLKQERAGKLTATQNMIVGTFTGGCHLASGILYTTVGDIARGKTRRDAYLANNNLGAAAIVSLPGNAVAILDTLRIQAQAEINRHKAAKVGKLPSQLFTNSLTQLDHMEDQLHGEI